jgi:hypothetical protein
MTKFAVVLKDNSKFEIEADQMSAGMNESVTFFNRNAIPDSNYRDSFGAVQYRQDLEVVAFFAQVQSVVKVA